MTNDNRPSKAIVIDLAELREAKRLAQQISRSQFGTGPWNDEPNHAEWVDQETQYPCLMLRHDALGHWCGYVGVFGDHPCYGRDYDKIEARILVHGGLNYSSFRAERRFVRVTPETPWWFGFDCAHAFDTVPAIDVGALKKFKEELDAEMREMLERLNISDKAFKSEYRTFDWVRAEVTDLANQLGMIEHLGIGAERE